MNHHYAGRSRAHVPARAVDGRPADAARVAVARAAQAHHRHGHAGRALLLGLRPRLHEQRAGDPHAAAGHQPLARVQQQLDARQQRGPRRRGALQLGWPADPASAATAVC